MLAALLELTPLTGRKHQLRVHCAQALLCPIVGDTLYGPGYNNGIRAQLATKRVPPSINHIYFIVAS
eukprot:m.264615 g.264615  ORF g.264615 m.264615 type:complete len:67 (-) comp17624_c0_seq6:5968-6168(-)